MAMVTLQLPDKLKAIAERRALEAGFSDLGQFISQLIVGEAVGAPQELSINSDSDIEALLDSRIDGPFSEMDAADFQNLRNKFRSTLELDKGRS